jgi:hypothetical protein
MRTYLVRIPHRQGHSIQSVVLLASAIAGPGRRIQVTSRVGPNGRDLKLPQGQLGSNNRTAPWFLQSPLCPVRYASPCWRVQYLWPGRRIGLCCEATRAPSQGPRPNGAARGRPLPFGIGTKALNPLGWTPPRRRSRAHRLIRTVVSPFRSFPPPRGPGTRHRSSVCSACAR